MFTSHYKPCWVKVSLIALKSQSNGAGVLWTTRPPDLGLRFAAEGVIQKFTFTAAWSACAFIPVNPLLSL